MIDPLEEPTFPLSAVLKKAGIDKHPSTIHRWRHPGVRGVRLETVRIGGVHHTSLSCLRRFFATLSEGQARLPGPRPLDDGREARIALELKNRFGL